MGPDVPATLGWLAAQVPGLPKDVFRALPRPGTLAGRLDLSEDAVNLSNLALHLGDSVISGRATLTLAGRPVVRAKLTADHVDLDALPDSFSVPGALAGDFAGFDADLDLTASAARMRGTSLTNFAVKLLGSAGGLQLRRCAADLPGLHGEGAVAIGTDGTITDGHLELTAQDAALLPRAWRTPDLFWQGPAHVAVTANGPPQQILAELRADIGDLRAEAEGRVDAIAQHLSATVTLRHPGAPRLLETLGVPGAQRWLDTGSVSFQAHLAAWPGHVEAQDFSLSAAALHLGGQIAADFTGPVPSLTGQIEAANLTLPRADGRGDAALPFASLGDWQADLHMHAGLVSWGAETIATGLNAQVTKAGGIVLTDLTGASVAGGTLVGQAVIDSTALSPAIVLRFGLINAALDNLPALPPFPLTNGSVSMVADLAASGYSPAALLATAAGDVHASVRDAALAGIDLAALRKALVSHAPRLRAALQSALSSGTTTSLAGDIDATLRDGALTLRAAQLASDAGSIETTGSVDLAERSTDLALALTPAVSAPPVVNLFLFGPWPGARHPGNLRAALAWAAGSRK
jgi:hypothetical protein